MPHYRAVGTVPRKRHTRSGLYEELVGEDGFSGASSLLYHRHSPSAMLSVEAAAPARDALVANHPLLPRHLRPAKLAEGGDPVTGRTVLAGNDHVNLCWWAGGVIVSPLHRDAMGDELVYVQSGAARLETGFGNLELRGGDYAVIPASAVHRWVVHEPSQLLIVEAVGGHVRVPSKYLGAGGQMREGAPFSERDIRSPGEATIVEEDGPVDVLVRTRAGVTRHVMANHPFDVVGWDGCCYPWAFNILDFEPIVGRLHQPPPVHQTFEASGFVVCSFVPRLFDTDPDAVKIPYHHANVDSDEVLFYSQGDFMSRGTSGIGQASISIHPAGFTHGPQPGSLEASADADRTEEIAVMLDTFSPLLLSADALSVEDEAYWSSWVPRC